MRSIWKLYSAANQQTTEIGPLNELNLATYIVHTIRDHSSRFITLIINLITNMHVRIYIYVICKCKKIDYIGYGK